MPIQFRPAASYLAVDIVWHDGQHPIQYQFFVSVASEVIVAYCNLLKQVNVAWIEAKRALEVSCRLFPAALTALNETAQLEDPGIIRQALVRPFQFSERAIIIEVSCIKIPCPCEMCLSSLRMETERGLKG